MTKRREFSRAVKDAAYARSGGGCEKCGIWLRGIAFRYDHIIPDGIGGEPNLENCQVICMVCDRKKTLGDQTRIAKTKRQNKKHLGLWRPSRSPLPGGKNSRLKKRMTGEVVPR